MTHRPAPLIRVIVLLAATVALARRTQAQFGSAAQAATMTVRYDTETTAAKRSRVSSIVLTLPGGKDAAVERVVGALTDAGYELADASPMLVTTAPVPTAWDFRMQVTVLGAGPDSARVTIRGTFYNSLAAALARQLAVMPVQSYTHGVQGELWKRMLAVAARIQPAPIAAAPSAGNANHVDTGTTAVSSPP